MKSFNLRETEFLRLKRAEWGFIGAILDTVDRSQELVVEYPVELDLPPPTTSTAR